MDVGPVTSNPPVWDLLCCAHGKGICECAYVCIHHTIVKKLLIRSIAQSPAKINGDLHRYRVRQRYRTL